MSSLCWEWEETVLSCSIDGTVFKACQLCLSCLLLLLKISAIQHAAHSAAWCQAATASLLFSCLSFFLPPRGWSCGSPEMTGLWQGPAGTRGERSHSHCQMSSGISHRSYTQWHRHKSKKLPVEERGDGKTLPAIALSVLKERLAFPKVKSSDCFACVALQIDFCWRYSSGQVKLAAPWESHAWVPLGHSVKRLAWWQLYINDPAVQEHLGLVHGILFQFYCH